ncbi:MG406 family protein [Mycoplasma bradburyae]|uniref:MG406 family protein n=1 Tax=Mycoplasma bradburyae TaxID=2963128 RepID=A0AAW6HPK0_9MOLU|nr:MG406 family protein [Mycoplasma bradburyae]MDC4163338.1 MG406 family protein [Mycoplasma bradburyae]MDC4181952.1 MG406 family protein [Mycoplasma bradburyae]MDC4182655.1 MG406 family protein [Mycoplasma bradburyae]MDC4183327.1 MG406 family protein [Mycoplasma bradburyae]MDC4184135.1 MG406 family protein [Mycoplasma bradburyae]
MVVDKKTIKYNLIAFNAISLLALIIISVLSTLNIISIAWVYSSLLTIFFSNISLIIALVLPNLLYKLVSKLNTQQVKSTSFGFFMFGLLTHCSRILWYVIPIIIIGITNRWKIESEYFNVFPAIIWPITSVIIHIIVNYWLINKDIKEQDRLKELNRNVATGDSLQEAF